MEALNGFLMTQRKMTLKHVCGYIILEGFIGQSATYVERFLGWYCRYD